MKKLYTILTMACMSVMMLQAQELANFTRQQPVKSPEIVGDTVIFRLNANYATQVSISGNWGRQQVSMTKDLNGVWTGKMTCPEPEIYTYNFVVDGVSVNDPVNYMVQRDGTRYLNMLFVPGARSENYYESSRRGTVQYVWYDSESLGINRRMAVYTPYGYENNKNKKYPVLYLLHGGGGDEEAWPSMGRAAQIMDNLIEKGLAEPMIVVMPNGNPNQQAACIMGLENIALDRNDPKFANAYVNSLVKEIIPFVEKNFRAIPNRASRAISGLSMGGGHTTSATILYPGTFDYICPLSCGIRDSDELDAQLQGIKKAGYKLYWIGCGSGDTLAYKNTQVLDQALERNGMEHTTYISDGGHEWKNWRLYLTTFAQLLFK